MERSDSVLRRMHPRLLRHLAVLLLSTLMGAVIAYLLLPSLFRAMPNDLSRLGKILVVLHSPRSQPKICFFGNSVVMNGIDGRRLSQLLPGRPEVWNLGGTGQQLWESVLLQQELPGSVEVVVQGVFADTLEQPPSIPKNKYNALVMYGFQPSQQTLEWADRFLTDDARRYIHTQPFRYRFDARWAIRSWFDTCLRGLVRRDLTIARAEQDLYYPRAYTRKVNEKTLRAQLQGFISLHPRAEFHPDPRTEALIGELARNYRRRGIRYVLWILPRHPEYQRRALGKTFTQRLTEYLTRLEQTYGVSVVNSLNALPAERFVDGSHPDEQGADLLCQSMVAKFKETQICFSTRSNSSSFR